MTQGILGTRYLAAVGIPFHPTTNRLSPASLVGNRRSCQAHSASVRFLVPNGEVCSFMSVGRVAVYFSCIPISTLIFICTHARTLYSPTDCSVYRVEQTGPRGADAELGMDSGPNGV